MQDQNKTYEEKSQEIEEAIETAILVAFIKAKRKENEKYDGHISAN